MKIIETEQEKKSLLITTISFALLLLLFFYLKFSNNLPLPEFDGGGGGEIAVNFGNSDFGSGDNIQSKEVVTVTPKQVAATVSNKKEILISENEKAPAIVAVRKPATKIVKTEVEKPVVKPIPKPSKTTSDALSNLVNGSNKNGDGDDKTAGNKGKSNGNSDTKNYNGGGGTGAGSGGGDGSGQGLGTGSGYGNGNGSGNGNGNYQLGNRKALSKPQPNYVCDEEGIVVVQIFVNKSGKVTNANPGVRGTTNSAKCLLDQAETAAMNTKWQSDASAADTQVGKIIYSFKLTQ